VRLGVSRVVRSAGVVLLGAVAVGAAGGGPGAAHPAPRRGVTAAHVLPPAQVPRTPGALEAYEAARRVPRVLDGLYCYCHCSQTFGHRSLLTCFESEHASGCDICMGEARLAQKLASQQTSLAAIRRAIDAQFGS